MTTTWYRTLLLGSMLLAGCSTASAGDSPPGAVSTAYVFGNGSATFARVIRTILPSAETLHGDLTIVESHTRVVEDVSLDAAGRLARAEVVLIEPAASHHLILVPAERLAELDGVRFDPGASAEPWTYLPPRGEAGAITTPIAAWVTYRAASAGSLVRVIDPSDRRSDVLVSDQLAFPTDTGTSVVVGDSAVEVDSQFVTFVPERTHGVGTCRIGQTRPKAVLAM